LDNDKDINITTYESPQGLRERGPMMVGADAPFVSGGFRRGEMALIAAHSRPYSVFARNRTIFPLVASLLVGKFAHEDVPIPDNMKPSYPESISFRNFEPVITIDSCSGRYPTERYTVNDTQHLNPVVKEPSKLLLGMINRIKE
jgi:hypothetical protein